MDLHYKVIASINSPKIQVNLSVKMPGHLGCNGPIGFHTALIEKKRKLNFSKQVKRVQVQNWFGLLQMSIHRKFPLFPCCRLSGPLFNFKKSEYKT